MSCNLFNMDTQIFEHLVQSIFQKLLGDNSLIFGSGRDGARELTFRGKANFPNSNESWNGYWVIQAKYKEREEANDFEWIKKNLENELNKFKDVKRNLEKPDNYILITNAKLSAVSEVGGRDKIEMLLESYKGFIKNIFIASNTEVCSYIDNNINVRAAYSQFITTGDVIHELYDSIQKQKTSFTLPINEKIEITDYIPRKIYKHHDSKVNNYLDEISYKPLIEILNDTNRVILLGEAGIGKSSELKSSNNTLIEKLPHYTIIFSSLRNYTKEETLKNFLPKNWDHICENLLVLILDGLDEVLPHDRISTIMQINNFVEKHKSVKILLSCRTNVFEYEHPILENFEQVYIKNFDIDDVEEFYKLKIENDSFKDFMNEVRRLNLEGFLFSPYYLMLMVEIYKRQFKLPATLIEIFEEFIDTKFRLDLTHHRNIIELREKKHEILKSLGKLALALEIKRARIISKTDLLEILSITNFEEIKYCTVFQKVERSDDKWQFDHNNIQEFLAAKALSRYPFEKVKDIISFELDGDKIKPNWINTVNFLFSMIDTESDLSFNLFKWMSIENQDTIVRLEKSKIPVGYRERFLINLYNDFKKRDILIYPNFYSNEELAEFGESDVTYKFIVSELNVSEQDRIPLINSLILIGYFKNLGSEKKEELKSILFKLLSTHNKDKDIVQNIITVFKTKGITDSESALHILELVRTNKNEWVRTAMYRLISATNIADDVFEYLLEGIDLLNTKGDPEREDNNLINEQIQLGECFKKIKNPHNLKKLISCYDSQNNTFKYFSEKLFESIIQNSIGGYEHDSTIFDSILRLYVDEHNHHNKIKMLRIQNFFIATGTNKIAISEVSNSNLYVHFKSHFIATLINTESDFEVIKNETEKTNLKQEQIRSIYIDLYRINPELAEKFYIYAERYPILKFEKPEINDHKVDEDLRKRNEIEFLFDLEKFKHIITKNIERLKKKGEITRLRDIYDYESRFIEKKDEFTIYSDHILNFFRIFSDRVKNIVDLSGIESHLENEKYLKDFLFGEIFSYLTSHENYEIDEIKVNKISDWCRNKIPEFDFRRAINEKNGNLSYNGLAVKVWFFYKKYHFELPENILLDMLSFGYYFNEEIYCFNDIVGLLPKEKVRDRIIENLRLEIIDFYVLRNHIRYVFENNISDSYSTVLRYITKYKDESYEANELIKMYFEKTKDTAGLYSLLTIPEYINWKIVELLIQNGEFVLVKNELEEFISSSHNDEAKKFIASQYLIRMQSIKGFEYYKSRIQPVDNIDLRHTDCLKSIESIDLIAGMFELLELSYQKEIKIEPFYTFNKIVVDALFSIAMKSKTLYDLVRCNLQKFQEENLKKYPDVKYLKYDLDTIDKRFRELYVHVPDIEEVKAILKELGL